MTSAEALARRAELQAEHDSAQRAYSEWGVKHRNAEVLRGITTRDLAALKIEVAKGNATEADLDAAQERLDTAERDWKGALDRTNSALDAVKATIAEIDALLADHLEPFAEQAQSATDEAHAALLSLEDGFRRAQHAWQAAQGAWAPVARAARVEGVQPFPLPDVFTNLRAGHTVARPLQVTVISDAEMADVMDLD